MLLLYLILLGMPFCKALLHESGFECPDSWTFDETSETCVKQYVVRKTWNQAKEACKGVGAYLAIIKHVQTTHTIKRLLKARQRYWIGISDEDNDGEYKYLDGTVVSSYRRWANNEPSNHGGDERCVEMIGNNYGSWNDKRCSKKRYFVCQLPAQMMLECPPDWNLYEDGKICVQAFENRQSWSSARSSCQNSGGDLVVINNKETSRFVRALLSRRERYWIGAWDENEDDKFVFVNGEKVSAFQRWARKEPNNLRRNERCLEVIGNRRVSWNDKRCGKRRRFVCSRPADVASIPL